VNRLQEACQRVHWVLGPGFLHQVYRRHMIGPSRRAGLRIHQPPLSIRAICLAIQDVRLILVEARCSPIALRSPDEALEGQEGGSSPGSAVRLLAGCGTNVTVTVRVRSLSRAGHTVRRHRP
jgi:hypothetical protein